MATLGDPAVWVSAGLACHWMGWKPQERGSLYLKLGLTSRKWGGQLLSYPFWTHSPWPRSTAPSCCSEISMPFRKLSLLWAGTTSQRPFSLSPETWFGNSCEYPGLTPCPLVSAWTSAEGLCRKMEKLTWFHCQSSPYFFPIHFPSLFHVFPFSSSWRLCFSPSCIYYFHYLWFPAPFSSLFSGCCGT